MRFDDPENLYGTATASAPAPSAAPAAPPAYPTYTPPAATSAPPASSPSGGSITLTPGYTPDYASLITSDPQYLSAQSNADLAQSTAAAQRKQRLQQAVIQYGGLPASATDQYGDVSQDVLDQAGQNQFSVLANLAKSYAQNEEQFRRGLSARGALQSSELDYGENQLQNAYGQQRYDAANAFGSQANDALSAYASVIGDNARNLTSAIGGAEQNVYANPAYRPTPAKTANYDASSSSLYGQPIYADESGTLYDANGNIFTPKSSAAAAPDSGLSVPPPYVPTPIDQLTPNVPSVSYGSGPMAVDPLSVPNPESAAYVAAINGSNGGSTTLWGAPAGTDWSGIPGSAPAPALDTYAPPAQYAPAPAPYVDPRLARHYGNYDQ